MDPSDGTTNTNHSQERIEEYNEGFKIGIIVCLSIAAVVGFVGNGLVVAVILRAKKMRSVMNRFILNLAVSDLIVSVLAIPLFLIINFDPNIGTEGTSSVVVCKIARFFQYLSPEASMTLLITIGWNRHQAVVHPLNMMSYRTANKLIIGAWIYALVVVSPSLYLTKIEQTVPTPGLNLTRAYCATIPATTTLGLVYVMFLSVLGYVIPLASLIILYSKIYKTVWRRKSGALGDTRPVEAFIRSRKKVLKMFLTVIFIFLLTWLPLIIYIGAIESTIKKNASHVDYVRLITYSFGLCNSVCNPFIYALFNAKFRAGCKAMFRDSFNVVRRPKPTSGGNAAVRAGPIEPPQPVLGRKGGFHGTKAQDSKPSDKKDNNKKEQQKEAEAKKASGSSTPVSQLIGRRFRSLTDVDAYKNDPHEVVELITFQKVDTEDSDTGETVFTSLGTSSNNSDNCERFTDDSVFEDDSKDSRTADHEANGVKAGKNKDGYSALKEDVHSPAAKRTRSEGYAYYRNKHDSPGSRIRSTPAMK